ncbi:SNF2-related protein [Neptuniibacter sp. QD37_11]|uniref:SNF2-related protein n=1 Tax=Neptuniibacter sp. QD37_11 TaxID=3398209 RepID=UPI0039F56FD2
MLNARTYGSLFYQGGQWILKDIEPHVTLRLKQNFAKIPKWSAGPFHLEDTKDIAADLEWFMQRYPLVVSQMDRKRLKKMSKAYYKDQADADAILMPTRTPTERVGLFPGQEIRWYQKISLDLYEQVKNLLLIDDVGLGKTYEGLATALIPGTLPMVIVVEPHLQDQWAKKANQFIDLKVHKVQGNKPYNLPEADIYIFKYNQMGPWVDVLTQGWVKSIVFDEVQQLRTGTDSAKGKAAKAICDVVPMRLGMTATLIYNYGIEAWNIVNILRPGLLGTRDQFIREWCKDGNVKGIVKDPAALGAYLRETHMMLRRTKKDVGQEAKQERPHVEWVEPNTKRVAEAEALAEQLAIKTLSSNFHEAGMAAREFDLKMREMTGIAKAHQTAAYVRMFIEAGQPVLLFGYHHEVYRIWEEELADLNPLFYTGKQTGAQKEKNKMAFINGESDLLIMSLRSGAGADGIQHRASTVVFGEFDWSPLIHHQCIGRLDRDGQEDPVFVFYVATNFGSDPEMIDTLGVKQSQSDGIMDQGKSPIEQQADTDRLKRLAKSFLKSRGIATPETPAANDTPISDAELAAVI